MSTIRFKPQGLVGFVADMLMTPLMYLLQGNVKESPQRTHRWNNRKVRLRREVTLIKSFPKIRVNGDPNAKRRWFGPIPLFHMPVFGGWKQYVVLKPVTYEGSWFIGWYPSDDAIGISLVPVKGPVRVLLGPDPVTFFGVTKGGRPIPIYRIGEGTIGLPSPFSRVPLR